MLRAWWGLQAAFLTNPPLVSIVSNMFGNLQLLFLGKRKVVSIDEKIHLHMIYSCVYINSIKNRIYTLPNYFVQVGLKNLPEEYPFRLIKSDFKALKFCKEKYHTRERGPAHIQSIKCYKLFLFVISKPTDPLYIIRNIMS